jgi:hypothetical protein
VAVGDESPKRLRREEVNKVEARNLLEGFLEELKNRSREELLGLISNPVCIERTGKSGTVYQIEYEAWWDFEPGGDLRIIASIDDGGLLSALKPLTADFLVSSQGRSLNKIR